MKSRIKKNKNYMDFAAWTVLICINYSQKEWNIVNYHTEIEGMLKSSPIVIACQAFQNIKLQQYKCIKIL